ncbi:hypothetical protein [Sphingomonas sp. UYP23]
MPIGKNIAGTPLRIYTDAMDAPTREDRMTDINLDGTWTMIMGDQEADPDQNLKIVVVGEEAWDGETPDVMGTCSLIDGLMTITLPMPTKDGGAWPMMITARAVEGRSLSGNVHSSGPGGIEFSDPCILVRGLDLYARPKRAWTRAGDFIDARATD